MGRIADAMRAELDRMRELDRRQQDRINELLATTRQLINDSRLLDPLLEDVEFGGLDD